ncbi:aldehyde dehydrogenase family protein, partial [Pseudomonas aeruginosa]|uniref:aldehyde dehydrogenase family protein n=1 Tax=Pseudomonas aeruginosa TaxID=287 RepID=UPI000A6EC44F
DTEYGLGAGLWTRDINRAYRMGRGIKAGRVWTNCYHLYPAHAAFGGYKKSGVGRETHKMMLDHYQQTKNLLVSYDIDPLDTETMVGAQASQQQYEKILSYLDIAQQEGAELLAGGSVEKLEGNLASGYYIQPTLLKGHNGMRVFQEEIFGPVVGVTTFKDEAEALAIANDTEYGLGAGLWTRDINRAYRMGRGIKAGRVWTNCYHLYPAHAAFGGYKKSGVGRETHKMMLDHYQQTKNLLVSYDIDPL